MIKIKTDAKQFYRRELGSDGVILTVCEKVYGE
jgi:hypothetical protein